MNVVEAHGAEIPTFELRGSVARNAVAVALEVGYRHIDTAQIYGNEAEVAEAIEASGLPREDIFLTTKIWPDNFGPTAPVGRGEPRAARHRLRRSSAASLALGRSPAGRRGASAGRVENRGARRPHRGEQLHHPATGRSGTELPDAADDEPGRIPHVSRPVSSPRSRRPAPDGVDRLFAARTRRSLRQRRARRDRQRYGKSAGQVALRWLLQQPDVALLPRSSDPDHIEANFAVFDFELTEQEIAAVTKLTDGDRRLISPAGLAPAWD